MPTTHGKVVSWASDIEAETIEQAQRAARLPFVSGHVALMPDAHVGKGATIGSVIPTTGAVIPAAVGVDIGCGMIAVETTLDAQRLPDSLDPLLKGIEVAVPAGMGNGHQRQGATAPAILGDHLATGMAALDLSDKQRRTAITQFGSLGSGNHFVEVCLDERDVVWVVLHSGSRGIG
ncbi:MAG TPA: RtcB family protein, partial [Acidimicrobiales bacterium]|nr:RtcB family protein [Acidimicrobiales bacterium]